jgi:hypothetical protein
MQLPDLTALHIHPSPAAAAEAEAAPHSLSITNSRHQRKLKQQHWRCNMHTQGTLLHDQASL